MSALTKKNPDSHRASLILCFFIFTNWIFDDLAFDQSKSIIEDYEQTKAQAPSDKTTWICRTCGESLEDQFTQ